MSRGWPISRWLLQRPQRGRTFAGKFAAETWGGGVDMEPKNRLGKNPSKTMVVDKKGAQIFVFLGELWTSVPDLRGWTSEESSHSTTGKRQ